MKLSRRRIVGVASVIIAVISFSRVMVLFLESMASVRDERSADTELISACKSGIARGSAKMRGACLQAQADRASPLLLKSIVRAVSVAFTEFSESISSPFGFASFALFLLSSIVLPVIPWLKVAMTAFATYADDENEDMHQADDVEQRHVIVLNGTRTPNRWGMRKRVSRMLKTKTVEPATPAIVDVDFANDDGWVEQSLH
jgi:hypothetical protein